MQTRNLLHKIFRKLNRILSFIVSIPIAAIIIFIFPFYKIKLIRLFSDRIGHFSANTELLLCYLDEVKLTQKMVSYFFYTSEAPICNTYLLEMWKSVIPILSCARLAAYVDFLLTCILKHRYKNADIKKFENTEGNVDYTGNFHKHKPHLFFSQHEKNRGTELLSSLGIPPHTPFVCLLVRDSAYLNQYFPGKDWSYHNCRNANIDHFAEAALFLAKKGYYVIRMGKAVFKPFPAQHPNIIDYATMSIRSDFADIYLSSQCTFFISTSSGLDGIPVIFRKPILFVNVSPFAGELQYWYPGKFFIMKRVYDQNTQRFVPIREIDERFSRACNIQKTLTQLNWIVIENTSTEIAEAVIEMEQYLCHGVCTHPTNPLHALLKTKFPFSMAANRDFLASHPEKFYIRMCGQFFEENKKLLYGDNML